MQAGLLKTKIVTGFITASEINCEFETNFQMRPQRSRKILMLKLVEGAVGGDEESSGMQMILTLISADTPFESPAGFL